MASKFVIRKNQYYDSVFLMGISKRISDFPGVQQNAVLMGSEANKNLLATIGFRDAQIGTAQANDLIVAVTAETSKIADDVLSKLDEFFAGGEQTGTTSNPHSLEEGLERKRNANLVVISVPGEYAAREAHKALDAGLNVFLFSNNVSGKEELVLKRVATEKKLLVMGPDCGTSLIGGVGIGFANAVRRGSIGAIGVAGTGLQEFTSQVHNAGLGISHAIGTGGHDLSDEIGGLTTFAALDALEADPQTEIITIISKPPGEKTFTRLAKRFEACKKPVIGCFLGVPIERQHEISNVQRTATIDEAVQATVKLAGGKPDLTPLGFSRPELDLVSRERASWSSEQKYVRGLFAGGTFCYQSQQIFQNADIPVYSNAPLEQQLQLADSDRSREHTFVDMGSDEYTLGKPHPMIDGTLRRQRILAETHDSQVAILFLDFVLGYNASMDPVGELLDAILAAKKAAQQRGGALTVVASVCGTEGDPQDSSLQHKLLQQAGVIVFPSNARAASFCVALLK